jgi:hypothetical protein
MDLLRRGNQIGWIVEFGKQSVNRRSWFHDFACPDEKQRAINKLSSNSNANHWLTPVVGSFYMWFPVTAFKLLP